MPKDIAMHFNPRWDDPNVPNEPIAIIINHRSSNKWGPEDRHGMNQILKADESNEIIITYTKAAWRVSFMNLYILSKNSKAS